ncbi:hypothetical protein PR048_018158 [Dryococelus australis]|uniref:Peptidase A2 domain-containing protein n=1 Tax=Dryococelus australis TaxID=614101 RepID=A0ABQ9HBH3_9NEOP|nr:hypothetical protein PR048_018158 [Dryococelus australis]
MKLQTDLKKRAVMRSSFTKIFNTTSQLLHTGSEGEIDLDTIKANEEILHGKIFELLTLDECVFNLMLADGVDKDELEGELSGSGVYKKKYTALCVQISHVVSSEGSIEIYAERKLSKRSVSIAMKRFNIGSHCDSRLEVPGGSEMETSIASHWGSSGKTGYRHIRTLIDTGSQRFYITKELVVKVGYQSVGEEELRHSLFGGRQSNSILQGSSHNDYLGEGPNLVEAIPPPLLWSRLKPVGVIADIKKVFLHINLCKRDRDFVRFLIKDKGEREDTWSVFVHNKVQEIRRLSDKKPWRHVAGTMNPADVQVEGVQLKCCFGQNGGRGQSSSRWLLLSGLFLHA